MLAPKVILMGNHFEASTMTRPEFLRVLGLTAAGIFSLSLVGDRSRNIDNADRKESDFPGGELTFLAGEGLDAAVIAIDLKSGKTTEVIKAGELMIDTASVSPDGSTIALIESRNPHEGDDVLIFDVASKQVVSRIDVGKNILGKPVWSEDGERLAVQLFDEFDPDNNGWEAEVRIVTVEGEEVFIIPKATNPQFFQGDSNVVSYTTRNGKSTSVDRVNFTDSSDPVYELVRDGASNFQFLTMSSHYSLMEGEGHFSHLVLVDSWDHDEVMVGTDLVSGYVWSPDGKHVAYFHSPDGKSSFGLPAVGSLDGNINTLGKDQYSSFDVQWIDDNWIVVVGCSPATSCTTDRAMRFINIHTNETRTLKERYPNLQVVSYNS